MPLYAATVFLSAFLLFLVQPVIARQILPWFGGSAAVWATCLVFFQSVLLAGYAYSDFLIRKLQPRRQLIVHTAMLLLSLAFAGGFQMPVAVLVLGWARIVSIDFLTKNRKYALFLCSIVAALLTPADPFSMLLMMIPLYGLYELGILLLRWFPATRIAGNLPKRGDVAMLPASDMEGAEGP